MNRSLIVAVLTVTMIIMMSTASYALTYPHNYACDNCHGKFLGPSQVAANNACLTCHSALGDAPRMPVETDAMSNFFGSASGQPATGSRSTHTWGAYSAPGHPYNPKARVSEATNGALVLGWNNKVLTGYVTCFRCHNSKLDAPVPNPPFLRVTNTSDALCLDCHRSRNTSTHATGSHPVAYRAYSLVYKSNTTAFRKIPLSANVNNPTAQLGSYLTVANKGKIICSTCHAPHYADSSSATLGNRSTANGAAQDDPAKGLKGRLQDSKGQLLRTDPLGATASSINVCSSCHKETANINHNGNGQNIQCNHCHGAHVDYTGDNSLPNLYLVRRDFSSMSTTKVKLGADVKVIYNTATSLRWKRADNKGICQVCHGLPAGTAIHDLADTRAKDCMECHNHKNGFSAADCTSCHGQPPMTSTVGGPDGKASASYVLDESLTPHATHASKAYYDYACKNCHYDGTRPDSHRTTTPTFQSVFVETAGSVGDLTGNKNLVGDYNTSTRTCSLVYCHSNGAPRGTGSIAWKSPTTPSWEYGRNKIFNTATECTTCHEIGDGLVATNTNAHNKHITTNKILCSVCHAATVNNDNAILDRAKHANGTKDIKFATRPANFFGVFSSSWNAAAMTCNNSCHSNGLGGPAVTTPKWSDPTTGACGKCHAAVPATSLHFQHFSSPTGPKLGKNPNTVCANCHIYTGGGVDHANGRVDLNAGNSCAPCHNNTKPIWATGQTVSCDSCHTGTASIVSNPFGTYTAPLKPLNATQGHGQYAMAATCTVCHNATAPHIGAGPTEKRLVTSGNALCTTCHIPAIMLGMSTARANMLTHGVSYSGAINTFVTYTTANDYRARDCAGCHDTHGTTNYMGIRTVVAGHTIRPVTLATLSTALRVTEKDNGGSGVYNGLCQVCHTKVKYFTRNFEPDLTHNNGKNCLMCHLHKSTPTTAITFAFQGAGGGCGGCHGYPPASSAVMGQTRMNNYTNAKIETTSGAGGAHTVAGHIPKNAKQADGWANCNNCHNSLSHNTGGMPVKAASVNVIVDPTKYKFNNNSAINYTNKNCTNASCHFKKTPNWTTGLF